MRKEKGKVIIVALIILLDQLLKTFVVNGGFGITNKNIVFGLLSCYLAILLPFLLLLFFWGLKKGFSWGIILIFSGGLSNLIDRVLRGGVIDFIDIKIIPVFNLADIMICVGLLLFLIDFIFKKRI